MTKRFIISEREKNSILKQHNSKKNFFIDDTLFSKLIIREQYDTKKLDDLKAEILSGLNNLKTNNPMFLESSKEKLRQFKIEWWARKKAGIAPACG